MERRQRAGAKRKEIREMKNPTWTKIYREAEAANAGRLINGLVLVTDPDVMDYVNARNAAEADEAVKVARDLWMKSGAHWHFDRYMEAVDRATVCAIRLAS
jgi:hypothetical protein